MYNKLFFIISVICFISFAGNAQDYRADVLTPNGSQVVAYITSESSDAVRAAYDAEKKVQYPNARFLETYFNSNSTVKYSSSRKFNCHGYAWHMSTLINPLSEPRWIGYYPGNTDEHIYWTDSSYINIPVKMYPGMVSWQGYVNGYEQDHSAITTSHPDSLISKWRDMPFAKHKVEDSPYGGFGLKYYIKKPTISGPSTVCDQATYTIENLPTGATVQWGYSLNLLPLENNNHTVRVKRAIPPAGSSSGYISATLSLNGTEVCTLREDLWVGPPGRAPLFINVIPGNPYTSQQVILQTGSDNPPLSGYHFKWDLGSHSILSGSPNDPEILIETQTGLSYWATFRVSAENACGCSPIFEKRVYVTQWGGGDVNPQPAKSGDFTLSPNPATDMVTVEFTDQAESGGDRSPGPYEIQLWSAASLLRTYKTDQSAHQISVSDLPKGIYFVRVIKDGKTQTKKLLKR